jgi:hypothetical protein
MTIPTVTRWWALLLAVVVVSAVGGGATASAATPEHVKQSAVAPAVDLPPDTVCDCRATPGAIALQESLDSSVTTAEGIDANLGRNVVDPGIDQIVAVAGWNICAGRSPSSQCAGSWAMGTASRPASLPL